jgi:hypothetical protein
MKKFLFEAIRDTPKLSGTGWRCAISNHLKNPQASESTRGVSQNWSLPLALPKTNNNVQPIAIGEAIQKPICIQKRDKFSTDFSFPHTNMELQLQARWM